MVATFQAQLKALLWRNVLLKRRSRKQLLQEIFFPLLYVGILILIKALTKPSTKPPLSFPVIPLDPFSIDTSKSLIVVSNGLNITPVMTEVAAQLNNVTYDIYKTRSDADAAYNLNSANVTVGIEFGYPNKTSIQHYAIRMPPNEIASTHEDFTDNKDQGQCRGDDNNLNGTGVHNCDVNTYLRGGFAHLQTVIDQALMKVQFQINVSNVKVSVWMMPKGEYTPSFTVIQTFSSIYFVMAYSFFVNYLTVNLVAEKEKKIREGMFMMGLRNSVFWLSWSLVYFLIIVIVTSLVTVLTVVGKFFENSNVFIFWLILMLYGLSVIAISFLLTPFFKKARTAGIVGSFLTMLLSLIYLAVSESRTITPTGYDYGVPPGAQWALCLLSPVGLALAVDKAIFLDISGGGMTFDSLSIGDFPLYAPMIMLALDVVLYFLLAVYLDHVIPGEYGPRYEPWYFLKKAYWCPKQGRVGDRRCLVEAHDYENGGTEMNGPNIEPVPADMSDKKTMRMDTTHVNITHFVGVRRSRVTMDLRPKESRFQCTLQGEGLGKGDKADELLPMQWVTPLHVTDVLQGKGKSLATVPSQEFAEHC